MEKYYAYLVDLGFEPPTLVPMIAILDGDDGGTGGAFPGSAYSQSIVVGVKAIPSGLGPRRGYGQYAFNMMLGLAESVGPDSQNRLELAMLLSDYFDASFSGGISKTEDKWLSTLFDLRRSCGKAAVDKSLYLLCKLIKEPFYQTKERQDFNPWFETRLHNSFLQANVSDENIVKFLAILQRHRDRSDSRISVR